MFAGKICNSSKKSIAFLVVGLTLVEEESVAVVDKDEEVDDDDELDDGVSRRSNLSISLARSGV